MLIERQQDVTSAALEVMSSHPCPASWQGCDDMKLPGEIEGQAQSAVTQVEVQFLDVPLLDALLRPGPDL